MPEHTLAEKLKNRKRILDDPGAAPETAGSRARKKKVKVGKPKIGRRKKKASAGSVEVSALNRQIQILKGADADPALIAKLRDRIAAAKK